VTIPDFEHVIYEAMTASAYMNTFASVLHIAALAADGDGRSKLPDIVAISELNLLLAQKTAEATDEIFNGFHLLQRNLSGVKKDSAGKEGASQGEG